MTDNIELIKRLKRNSTEWGDLYTVAAQALQECKDDCQDTLREKVARIEKLEGELKIKSEFLSSRQCPDHSGKWQRGDCLQCEIERLRDAYRSWESDFNDVTHQLHDLRKEQEDLLYANDFCGRTIKDQVARIEALEKVAEAARCLYAGNGRFEDVRKALAVLERDND